MAKIKTKIQGTALIKFLDDVSNVENPFPCIIQVMIERDVNLAPRVVES